MREPLPSWDNPKTPDLFVVGALNRSGTTYVADALVATGHFVKPSWGFEDYLHAHSGHLLRYVQETLARWRHNRPDLPDRALLPIARDLGHSLGAAMSLALRNGGDARARLVLKTPEPSGIEHFFALQRHARLLLVIRDGRDTIESARRSWSSWSIEAGARTWAANVRVIDAFYERLGPAERERCLLVRYEDLVRKGRAELTRIFRFARLPTSRLPWKAILNLPLRGSSTERGSAQTLHWQPVARPRDFNPIGRWHAWSKEEKRAFERAAGKELRALGYTDRARW